MKLEISSSSLYKKITSLSGVINSKPLIAILEDFLFSVKNNILSITASDLQTTITTKMKVQNADDFSVAIPSKILLDTLKNLSNQNITIIAEENNKNITIKSDFGEYIIAGHNANEFPTITLDNNFENQFSFSSKKLKRALQTCFPISSNDALKPVLNSIYFDFVDKELICVSTDIHRLVKYELFDENIEQAPSMIIPKKSVQQLINLIEDDENINITNYSGRVCFYLHGGETQLIASTIADKFPSYDTVIPHDYENTMTIYRLDLVASLKRLMIYTNAVSHQIQFSVDNNKLTILAEEVNCGNMAVETIPCSYRGSQSLSIMFNVKILLDLLQNVDFDEITFKFSDVDQSGKSNKAAVIVPNCGDEEKITSLIMPIYS